MRVAIVGTGVSGLTCAHVLGTRHDVTLFEAAQRPGGHARTLRVPERGIDLPVDTGFMVYNDRNYPTLARLFRELHVTSRESEMSFAVVDDDVGLEWCGSSPNTVFAQRRNVARTRFWRMLGDVVRFNRAARALLECDGDDASLAQFLDAGRWSRGFIDWYLVPMGAAIWSMDPEEFLRFPASAVARFFDNHGLLDLSGRPQWRTVVGGSARYVEAILSPLEGRVHLGEGVSKVVRRRRGVEVVTGAGLVDTFDHVIMATHSDEALRALADPSDAEREILGAISYRSNVATVHRDDSLLARSARVRASWNWHRGAGGVGPTLTYDLARLQGLCTERPLLLTLNRPEAVRHDTVIDTTTFRHPVFNAAALRAQRRRGEISGRSDVSFVGAYWGYGFHEDGARSAVETCRALGVEWETPE